MRKLPNTSLVDQSGIEHLSDFNSYLQTSMDVVWPIRNVIRRLRKQRRAHESAALLDKKAQVAA